MAVSGAVNFKSLCVVSIKGAPAKSKNKRGQEGKPGDNGGGYCAREKYHVGAKYGLYIPPNKTDKGHHHNQRPWCGFTEREAIDHLRGREPTIVA